MDFVLVAFFPATKKLLIFIQFNFSIFSNCIRDQSQVNEGLNRQKIKYTLPLVTWTSMSRTNAIMKVANFQFFFRISWLRYVPGLPYIYSG